MYICLCHAITEEHIKASVLEGSVTCISSLQAKLGVSTQCGSCLDRATSYLAELQSSLAHPAKNLPTKISSKVQE